MKVSDCIRPLKIGGLTLKNNVAAAPMAGYGDIAFRRLCKDFGAGLSVTEMISVNGLVHDNKKTRIMLARAENEDVCAVQLFGSRPINFYKALCVCEELSAFEMIDINMGCPVQKVVKQGEGSALMGDCVRAAEIVRACIEGGGGRPVSVKIRLGRGENEFVADEFAHAMQCAGAALITVHGRTAQQMYRGLADWDKIALVKKAVDIPVLGNGDVTDATAFEMRMKKSGVDGIMIGRGAVGHPQIFAEILGSSTADTREVIERHIDYMSQYFPQNYTVVNMRKHLACYLKGIPDMKATRNAVNTAQTVAQLKEMLCEGFGRL